MATMNKQTVYKLLEDKMIEYADYVDMPINPQDDLLSRLTPKISTHQIDPDMLPYTWRHIYVREGVARRLEHAATLLEQYDDHLQLEVVYGYRAPEVQQQLFRKFEKELRSKYKGKKLFDEVQRRLAPIEVAGHPAGAAVDIHIIKNGLPIDFGTRIWEFVPDSYTFSPFISRHAWDNRQLLRRIMMSVGFAPFDGEWWHFSYGDKEWARYYGRSAAIYDHIDFKI